MGEGHMPFRNVAVKAEEDNIDLFAPAIFIEASKRTDLSTFKIQRRHVRHVFSALHELLKFSKRVRE